MVIEGEGGDHRSGDTKDKISTHGRNILLEKSILYKLGLIREMIQVVYDSFFNKLLLIVWDVSMYGIRGDLRNAY